MTPSELSKLQAYLRKAFGSRTLGVRALPRADAAEFLAGESVIGRIVVDDEDGDRSYQLSWEIKEKPQQLTVQELVRLQEFLRAKLGSKMLSVRARGKLRDSAEVLVGEDSLAIISAEASSYQFQMAILDIDLDNVD